MQLLLQRVLHYRIHRLLLCLGPGPTRNLLCVVHLQVPVQRYDRLQAVWTRLLQCLPFVNTGHMDSKVEVAVGLVITMRTWDVENLVMDSFHVALHVLFTGKGFVTPVTLDGYNWFLLWLVTTILLQMALDILGCFGTVGASGHSFFCVSPSDMSCQICGDPGCVRAMGAVLNCILVYKTHMVGNILVHLSTYVTRFISLFVMSAVDVVLQHVCVLEVLSTCGAFLWLVSLHMGGKCGKSVQVHPTNAAHCPLMNLKLVLVKAFGMNC